MDESAAVALFIEHVTAPGHREIALVDGTLEMDTVYRRAGAARRLCPASGVSLTLRHAVPTEEGGWEVAMWLLRREPVPTACGLAGINQLFGLLGALRAAGVAVPGEISVVSASTRTGSWPTWRFRSPARVHAAG